LSNYWLANFGDFAIWTLGGPVVGYTVYNAVLAVVLYRLLQLPIRLRPLAFAAAWAGYELLKSSGYLAYPWGLAAYSFGDVLLMQQIADVTGVYGLSFLVVYANAALAELALDTVRPVLPRPETADRGMAPRVARHVWIAIALFAVAAGYGHIRLWGRPEPVDTIRAALVQPNIDPWQFGNLSETLTTLQRLSEEALERGDHDLLVWSETSLSIPYREYRRGYYDRNPDHQPFTEFLSSLDVPLLTGSPYIHVGPTDRIWNAVILIDPDTGDLLERYGKRHLVPFAEHVPLWELEPVRQFFQNVVGLTAVWSPADERVLFDVPTRHGSALAAVSISFEGAFAPLARDSTRGGAQLLINMTNNSWSRTESAQYQQFVVTRFRAIEARRTLMISTVSGLTALVDWDGTKLDSIPMFEEGALVVDAPIYESRSRTIYHLWGDSVGWAMIAVAMASLLGTSGPGRHAARGPYSHLV
jgi:apolipoprotein N-acyltransferase